jgi:hypothetical protein
VAVSGDGADAAWPYVAAVGELQRLERKEPRRKDLEHVVCDL